MVFFFWKKLRVKLRGYGIGQNYALELILMTYPTQCITIVRLFLGQQEKKYQKVLLNQSVYSKTVHPRKILFTESRGSSRFCNNKVVSDFEFGDFLSKGHTNSNCVFWYFFSRWPKNKRTILIKQVMHCVTQSFLRIIQDIG